MREFVFNLWLHDGMHGPRNQAVALIWRNVCVSILWLIPSTNSLRRVKRSSPFSANTSRTSIVHLSMHRASA
jgi:hypothetical protein